MTHLEPLPTHHLLRIPQVDKQVHMLAISRKILSTVYCVIIWLSISFQQNNHRINLWHFFGLGDVPSRIQPVIRGHQRLQVDHPGCNQPDGLWVDVMVAVLEAQIDLLGRQTCAWTGYSGHPCRRQCQNHASEPRCLLSYIC